MAPALRREASLLQPGSGRPTRCGWWPDPDIVGDAVLEALGEMTHFSGRRLARPFLPDVPAERLKSSYSLIEPGQHLADLLEL